ncbi:hypothetical protein GOODEAATRI_033343 [Goodea atripinnis]|uniref:Uncharacterized protein n=1 Tax=Goodea atripinnis TaxID=208336 RepID=A0ABV0PJ29_9TELE
MPRVCGAVIKVKGGYIQFAFRDLKLMCKHDIMSTITAYECPALKYCMHCCSISGPSFCSVPLKNCKHQPHEKQNAVNLLICVPQNGQNTT